MVVLFILAEEGKQGLEFISNIKGGNVPKEFIPSVEKGFKMAMQNGPLAGYEVDSMKVTCAAFPPPKDPPIQNIANNDAATVPSVLKPLDFNPLLI